MLGLSIFRANVMRTTDRAVLRSQGRVYLAFVTAWIFVIYYITSTTPLQVLEVDYESTLAPAYFHLIINAANPSSSLCKAMLSAAVLGYPTPIVVGWDASSVESEVPSSKQASPWISGVHKYLSQLDRRRDDNLVLIVESTESWLQLRPQTLIDRYFDVNRHEDEASPWDKKMDRTQTILFGTHDDCHRAENFTQPCYRVPSTVLSEETYYDPGVIVGPVKALRGLFEQALVDIETRAGKLNDKSILNRIAHDFDFGIELDYRGQISGSFDVEQDLYQWLTAAGSASTTLSFEPGGFAADINNTRPPFWTFTHERDIERWTSWEAVPLVTRLGTGIAPAIVHYRAPTNSTEDFRKTAWERTWFQKHARTMYDASIYDPILPVATSGYQSTSKRDWWPVERWKGGARKGDTESDVMEDWWLRFDEICYDYHEEIFGDGKGPWALPENH